MNPSMVAPYEVTLGDHCIPGTPVKPDANSTEELPLPRGAESRALG